MFNRNNEVEKKDNLDPENNTENQNAENPFSEETPEHVVEEQFETVIQTENETLKNQYIRLAADFDNYRKRQAQERECLIKYGAEDTLKKLLPVLDTFERAQKSIAEMDDPEKIKESFEVLQKQFMEGLEKIGLQKIDTAGQEFNPELHEAVMQTPTNDQPDNTIVAELQSGYKLHDRILRPAMVNVAVNE